MVEQGQREVPAAQIAEQLSVESGSQHTADTVEGRLTTAEATIQNIYSDLQVCAKETKADMARGPG